MSNSKYVSDDSIEKSLKILDSKVKTVSNIVKHKFVKIEGFYNYYSVPWKPYSEYVAFPVDTLIISSDHKSVFFSSPFDTDESKSFLSENYLGSAHKDDKKAIAEITEGREELVTDINKNSLMTIDKFISSSAATLVYPDLT